MHPHFLKSGASLDSPHEPRAARPSNFNAKAHPVNLPGRIAPKSHRHRVVFKPEVRSRFLEEASRILLGCRDDQPLLVHCYSRRKTRIARKETSKLLQRLQVRRNHRLLGRTRPWFIAPQGEGKSLAPLLEFSLHITI